MTKNEQTPPRKRIRCSAIYCSATLFLAALLLVTARADGVFAEWYALHIFPVFPHTLGRLFSLLPFSVLELLLLTLILGLILALLYCLTMIFSRRARAWLRRWLHMAPAVLFCALCSIVLLFTLSCGINYSRASIAAYVGIEAGHYSVDELYRLFQILNAQMAEVVTKIGTDSSGHFMLREPPRQPARAAMQELGRRYGGLAGYYPNPKPVFFSQAMSWLHITGIYSPFTMEANYNRDTPHSGIPFTTCHELAHLNGFMREDEANFIGYLACLNSDSADFRYSGAFLATIYVLNALHDVAPRQEYLELYGALPEQTRRDMQQNAAYWQRFAGPAAQLSQDVNDAYLKMNDQPEGVASYGRMVDLLLAYYSDF